MFKNFLSYAFVFFSIALFPQKKVSTNTFSTLLGTLLKHSVNEVSPNEIHEDKSIIFLDAREKEEYNTSHIKNAIWIGYQNFTPENVAHIPKNSCVVVYCSVGYRSEKITEKLIALGFSNASNLYGGIFEWVHQNKKVYHKNTTTTKVHTYNKTWSKWLQKGEKVY